MVRIGPQIIDFRVGIYNQGADGDGARGQGKGLAPAADLADVLGQDKLHRHELSGQGGHDEIKALDLGRGQTEKNTPDAGHQARDEHTHQVGYIQLQHQQGAGVGPHSQKGRVPQGHLAAVADQKLDAQGPHDGIEDQVGHADGIESPKIRDHEEDEYPQEDHFPDHEFGLPKGVVLPIDFVVNAAR